MLVALTAAGLVVANLRRGRAGLRLLAVRGNERAAAALGVSVSGSKLYGFSLAAGIAGLGGVLLAFRSVTVSYLPFTGFASIQVVVISVIGGIGYVTGALIAGTFALGGIGARVTESLGFAATALDLLSGALLVVILFANPNGIADSNVRTLDRVRRRRPSPARRAPPDGGDRARGGHARGAGPHRALRWRGGPRRRDPRRPTRARSWA